MHVCLVLLNSDIPIYCKTSVHWAKIHFHKVQEVFIDESADEGQAFHDIESENWVS